MTSLNINDADIPRLDGKVAIITGGSSGIGLATARIFSARGAAVHILDRVPIDESFNCHWSPVPAAGAESSSQAVAKQQDDQPSPPAGAVAYHHCDVTSWASLRAAFAAVGPVDIVVANAGVSQECDYFADTFDAAGELEEPGYGVIDVNLRAVLNVVKLSIRAFRQQADAEESRGGRFQGGSLVLTSSATAYAPELSLPVYSAVKLALIGLVRALRPAIARLCRSDTTINAVAPAATVSKLLPPDLAAPIVAARLPVSSAHHAGLAVAFSATAAERCRVEAYGRDASVPDGPGRWNGRVILTLGDRWTELEEPIARARTDWFGAWNAEMTARQQRLTDPRPLPAPAVGREAAQNGVAVTRGATEEIVTA